MDHVAILPTALSLLRILEPKVDLAREKHVDANLANVALDRRTAWLEDGVRHTLSKHFELDDTRIAAALEAVPVDESARQEVLRQYWALLFVLASSDLKHLVNEKLDA